LPAKRLKGAIDQRIAEEQARQKAALEAQRAAAPRRSRSSSGAGGPSTVRRSRPTAKTGDDGDGPTANPDPAVFEAAFVIDDADDTAASSRASTPLPGDKIPRSGESTANSGKAGPDNPTSGTGSPSNSGNNEQVQAGAEPTAKTASSSTSISELPPEIRARLRKLEKLEKTYPGMFA